MGRRVVGALLLLLLGAALVLGGCTVKVGVTQTLTVEEPLLGAAVTDVEVTMGGGKLSLAPGASGLVSGTIRFNVEAWKPEIKRGDTRLTIEQGSKKGVSGFSSDAVNDWDLELGQAPMRLRIEAGAYEGDFDLSGLTLQELEITDGAAKTKVAFTSPNPGQMERLTYETGASTVQLIGLANANFKAMTFAGGAGTCSLDFSGQLRTDGTVKVESGAGSVRIVMPRTTAARVTISGSLNDIDTEGTWNRSSGGDTFTTPAWDSKQRGKTLSISVEMSVGSVTLVSE
jgi:hypothetical protein